MASIRADVEPAVLRWARESINLPAVAASRKLKLPDDRVDAWEAGQVQSTVAQLKRAAVLYRRSLAVLFLPAPPTGFDTLRDFRRHDAANAGQWTPALHAEYRCALAQRDHVLELTEIDDAEPLSTWRLSPIPPTDDVLASRARELLLDVGPLDLPRGHGTVYDPLNTWVAALETAGVLVMATSGGRVSTKEMRAFSLYFDDVPAIMVNGSDAPRGRLFSLMHEYAHLLLHTGGLCDTVTETAATDQDRRLEARCNAIAASILMPTELVLAQPEVIRLQQSPNAWTYDSLVTAAAAFGTSAEAMLRRLLTLGRVTPAFYRTHRTQILARYEQEEENRSSGQGNWYRTTVRDRGKGYVRLVADAYRRRVISSYTAATFLDAKVGQIDKLAWAELQNLCVALVPDRSLD